MPVFRINLNQRELKSSAAISRKSTPIATSSTQFYTLPPRRSRAAPSSSQSVSRFLPLIAARSLGAEQHDVAVCAISSRYYTEKSEIYPIAMHFAKHAAASALLNGWKSVELSQAYILMSLYGVPARRWEEDRNWLYTGLAIRIATDLNLHVVSNVKPKTEKQEREMVNQTRVWLLCFNLDRSTASQFGKPSTIKED